MRAVWLQQTIILQMGQHGLRGQRDRASHRGGGPEIQEGQPRLGMRQTVPDNQEVVR